MPQAVEDHATGMWVPCEACLSTWLLIITELIDIAMTGLSQEHIVPEVSDLHLLKVEHLIPALLGLDLVPLVSQAAEHLAATGLMSLTEVATQLVCVCGASLPELEVQAVVLAGSILTFLNPVLALIGHIDFGCEVLQASAAHTMMCIMACGKLHYTAQSMCTSK